MARTAGMGSADAVGRTRILDAALEEFANRGFDGATTAAIARSAGVTQPLVHYHFASKDELWREAVRRELDAIGDSFGGIAEELGDLSPVDRLKVVVRRLVIFMAEHPQFSRIMAYEGVQGGPRLDWILGSPVLADGDSTEGATAGGVSVPLLDVVLSSSAAQGWAKPLPVPHVVSCLVAASAYFFQVGAAVRHQYGLDVSDPEVIQTHADTVVELFFHGLVKEPA